MSQEFHDRDLSQAEFWGVDLRHAQFRDTDLSGARFFHTRWNDVSIDGVVERLIVNGVDVTDFVNSHDRWFPLRTRLEPTSAEELARTWESLRSEWSTLIGRLSELPDDVVDRSANGEWSVRDTLRHLVFVMDKWFMWPILGVRAFSPIGLPNSGSRDLDWPGLGRDEDPSFDDVLQVRTERINTFTNYIASLSIKELPVTVDVLENGTVPTLMCFHAVLEEEFEHLRYVLRDLDTHL